MSFKTHHIFVQQKIAALSSPSRNGRREIGLQIMVNGTLFNEYAAFFEAHQTFPSASQVHMKVGERVVAYWCVRDFDSPIWWQVEVSL